MVLRFPTMAISTMGTPNKHLSTCCCNAATAALAPTPAPQSCPLPDRRSAGSSPRLSRCRCSTCHAPLPCRLCRLRRCAIVTSPARAQRAGLGWPLQGAPTLGSRPLPLLRLCSALRAAAQAPAQPALQVPVLHVVHAAVAAAEDAPRVWRAGVGLGGVGWAMWEGWALMWGILFALHAPKAHMEA